MLEWNVIYENMNSKEIKPFNVFKHSSFYEDIKKAYNEAKTLEEFEELVDREARYYFWCKCEYEVIVSGWPNEKTCDKIDIYTQLKWNWDRFIQYLEKELMQ